MDRKKFLKNLSLASGLLSAPWIHTSLKTANAESSKKRSLVKPPQISPGDTVAIVSPAGSVVSSEDIDQAAVSVKELGLKPKLGEHLGKRWGYLGGRDTQRLEDLHNAFKDPEVKAIIPIRGGYGSSRLLPMLDFELIRRHPKVFVGFSDNTSLIVTINQIARMVTFYGPNALYDWTDYTRQNWQLMLMNSRPAGLLNPPPSETSTHESIVEGNVQGELLGGNLSLLVQTLGTEWEIDTRDKIIFFEDVNESPYRIDRMLTHLWLARKLQVAKGFAIGHLTNMRSNGTGLDVREVIRDRFEPLGKPCYVGVTTGHISNILTLPLGISAKLDATNGTLKAIESAVS